MSTNDSNPEKPCNIDIVRHSTYRLSQCCGKSVSKTNTINDIICWKCNECRKLTAVVDKNGNRLN